MNILITGGASGLGEAITRLLAKDKNNTIFFTYNRSNSNALKVTNDLKNTISIKCDFKNEKELDALLTKIKQLDLNVLINNAYGGDISPMHFHKISPDKFSSDFNENIIPTIRITQEVIKYFRKKKNGKIITVLTSYLANVPPMGLSTYIANKAYLEKLTKVWASENTKFNISSNSISPSFMQTGLTGNVDERVVEQMISNHPLKKLLTIEEVAETVKFLVNTTIQVNGVDLIINAGVNFK